MPRTHRRWEPGAIHHVIARGHCGSAIFAADEDRGWLVRRAARAFRETGATCLAWSILSNHYHILVRCEGPPGPTFARLDSAIAWRVTRRRGGRGAVFQGRYFSDPCEDEGALLERFAYVLGNPVHHRLVPTIDALRVHPWSALGDLLGLRKPIWTDVDAALSAIDERPDWARDAIVRLLERKAAEWSEDEGDPAEDRGLPRAATPDDTPDEAPETAPAAELAAGGDEVEAADRVRVEARRAGWAPADLVAVACSLTGAQPEAVRAGARTRAAVAARAVVAFVACDVAGSTMVETARVLGVRPTALLDARRRGGEIVASLGVTGRELLERSTAGHSARSDD
jgi:REP-associated tyrosine transposase